MPMPSNTLRIAVLPGDGIGTEVTAATLAVLDPLAKRHGIGLAFEELRAGAFCYRDTGTAMSEETFASAAKADAILLGAMGWPEIRAADGTEIAPQLDLRFRLNLYAGVRPFRALPGVPVALADPRAREMDLVIVRESTEGLFHSRDRGTVTHDMAEETLRITRATTERLARFSFDLARRRAERRGRKGTVTLVDKANVFRAFAFMRAIFAETAPAYPDVAHATHYVDAMALDLVRKPWAFDVLPTENMFGDILSDLGAGLIGGMGFAPSADIGDTHAVFQPAHGTAPDIAGQGLANPTATILSAAMMLDWLAGRGAGQGFADAAAELDAAVDAAFAGGLRTPDIGGRDGTAAAARAVAEKIGATAP
ncbi:isocitrate/isopropylmalate dehydrogenase family protein [Roseomonas eburnea]|uniref:3-isopropylmalate dehydrogenase n=1 Tax=Neoroseomonas eburnea TaxID=1346889 RepID=A0A9X9XFG5_9PROT|nr:isocitrate/isopropylmalate family dehydrogenase [Neoroseomonas eburnea]MBR0682451.1 isocitrate/isopropylmalate dehydrogenase family protein [Neoroseomonas eburnea]